MAKKTTKKAPKNKTPNASDAPPPSKPPERVERFTENLPVPLSDAQVAERANRAAHRLSDRDHLEEELRAYNKTEKSKIAKIESEMRHLSEEVRTKTSYQNIPCERRYHYDTGRVIELRTDTGETISDRGMNEAEKQRHLFEDSGKGGDIDDEFSDEPRGEAAE